MKTDHLPGSWISKQNALDRHLDGCADCRTAQRTDSDLCFEGQLLCDQLATARIEAIRRNAGRFQTHGQSGRADIWIILVCAAALVFSAGAGLRSLLDKFVPPAPVTAKSPWKAPSQYCQPFKKKIQLSTEDYLLKQQGFDVVLGPDVSRALADYRVGMVELIEQNREYCFDRDWITQPFLVTQLWSKPVPLPKYAKPK